MASRHIYYWPIVFCFLLATLPSISYALTINEYTVHIDVDDRGLSQVTTTLLVSPSTQDDQIILHAHSPSSVIVYDVDGELKHAVLDERIIIRPRKQGRNYEITIKYLTNTLTSKKQNDWLFEYTDKNLEEQSYIDTGTYAIILYLPNTISLKSATPGGVTSLYGNHIAISWISEKISEMPVMMSVEYEIGVGSFAPSKTNFWKYLFIASILIAAIVLSYKPLRRKITKKASQGQKDIISTLDTDQANIVQLLLKQPEHKLNQREIEAETGLHKSTLSRYVKKLKQKNIVGQISVGNKNIVKLTDEFLKK